MEKNEVRNLVWIGLFAIAMAFVETMIVYYLRLIYYPSGFTFPLNTKIPSGVISLEWFREMCTIIMILGVSFLASKKLSKKVAYFAYAFGIWDIFYYIWLKIILNWPASFLTWDVLFLIPIPWLSPMLAPVIISITIIFFAIMVLNFDVKKIRINEWILLISGAIITIITFLWDYTFLILKNGFLMKFAKLSTDPGFLTITGSYVPIHYNWILFIFGEILAIIGIYLIYRRHKKKSRA
jgi:hypothetical protein